MKVLGLGSETTDGIVTAINKSIEKRVILQSQDGSQIELSQEEAEKLNITKV